MVGVVSTFGPPAAPALHARVLYVPGSVRRRWTRTVPVARPHVLAVWSSENAVVCEHRCRRSARMMRSDRAPSLGRLACTPKGFKRLENLG